jgi:hypothetical protein
VKAKGPGDGGSVAKKRGPAALPNAARAKMKSSTPIASHRTDDKGGADKNTQTSNENLAQGPRRTTWQTDAVRRLVMTKESSPMIMTHTGNASSLRWQQPQLEKGCGGGGCHMGLLSGFSLARLICEQTFCKRNNQMT